MKYKDKDKDKSLVSLQSILFALTRLANEGAVANKGPALQLLWISKVFEQNEIFTKHKYKYTNSSGPRHRHPQQEVGNLQQLQTSPEQVAGQDLMLVFLWNPVFPFRYGMCPIVFCTNPGFLCLMIFASATWNNLLQNKAIVTWSFVDIYKTIH